MHRLINKDRPKGKVVVAPEQVACKIFIRRKNRSRDNVVGIATVYGLDDREVGVRVPVDSRIFSSPRRPDGLCDPPSLLSNGYRGSFPEGKSGRGVKLATHFQIMPRSRKCGSTH
jgi:hypothetical protein